MKDLYLVRLMVVWTVALLAKQKVEWKVNILVDKMEQRMVVATAD